MQRFDNVSAEIKRVRKQMEEDEQLAILMRGLRGQNLRDSQFADENVTLRLVEVCFNIFVCLCVG
jgi:aarF domain-containing kinase